MRIGLVGTESDHAEDALRLFNRQGKFSGFTVVGMWGADHDRDRTQLLAHNYDVVRIVAEPADLVCHVDAVIVGDRDGGLHAAHALPFLEAGIPVFIDKPLARSVADAETMLRAAARSGALLLSGSALRWQVDTRDMKQQIAAKGELHRVTASGSFYPDSPHGVAFYAVHAVELALEFVGQTIEDIAVTEATGERMIITGRSPVAAIEMRLIRPAEGEKSRFDIALEAQNGTVSGQITLPRDYMAPVYEHFVTMLTGRIAPLSHSELLAPVRLLEAAEAAFATTAP